MNRSAYALIVLLLTGMHSVAALPTTLQIAEAISNQWNKVEGISFKMTKVLNESGSNVTELVWSEWGERFKYHKTQRHEKPELNMAFNACFDGVYHMDNTGSGKILNISKTPSIKHHGLTQEFFLTTPYEFLSGEVKLVTPVRNPRLFIQKINGGTAWIARQISDVKQSNLSGRQVLSFAFPGGKDDSVYNFDYFYRIFIDPEKNFSVIGWDKVDKITEYVFTELRVKELTKIKFSENQFLWCPKIMEIHYYGIKPKPMDGKPRNRNTFKLSFENIAINNLDQDDFTLDPSEFQWVFDRDKGAYITVPR